jgi:hypothetical protein
MMKIHNSSDASSAPLPSDRKSPVALGRMDGKGQGMPGKGVPADTETPLELRQNSLDRLLKELSAVKLPRAGTSFVKSLPSLRALLSLLKNASLPAGRPDLLLAEKFLQAWVEKYEGDFPDKISREIRFLSRLLKSEYQARRDPAMDSIYLEGEFRPGEDSPVWSMAVTREKGETSDEEQEFRSCTLDLNLPELGLVRAVLQYGKNRTRCGFYSSRRPVRQLIRGSLKDFRRHLVQRGFQKLQLQVGRSFKPSDTGRASSVKGVELWG